MKCVLAVLLVTMSAAVVPIHAVPIHGVATNGSTGKPQAGVQITLFKIDQGMVEIGKATTTADGGFSIDAPAPPKEIPYLVRGDYLGVGYHAAARDAEKAVSLTVFDKTSDHAAVKIVSEQIIVEPREGRMLVADIFTVHNELSPPRTLAPTGAGKDTFQFTVAKGLVQDLAVSVSGPTQLPLRQTASEHPNGVYGLAYPFRPGETKIEVNYRLPYSSGATFEKLSGKSLLAGSPEVTVIAPLEGVKLESPNLSVAKQEASQGAAFYAWSPSASGPLKFDINGVLPDSATTDASGASDAANGGGSGQQVSGAAAAEDISTLENQNFVFQARWKILIIFVVALGLGLAHLYRNALRS